MWPFGSIAYPLFAPDDLAPPGSTGGNGPILCGFCQCSLAANGDVLRRSERAASMLDLEDQQTQLRAEVDRVTRELAESAQQLAAARTELDTLRTGPAPAESRDYRPLFER